MPWTYLKLDANGALLPDSAKWPGPQTVYLAYDVVRNAVVLGYTERGGYHSILAPEVTGDCMLVAFAPLNETTAPDLEQICANTCLTREELSVSNMRDLPYLVRSDAPGEDALSQARAAMLALLPAANHASQLRALGVRLVAEPRAVQAITQLVGEGDHVERVLGNLFPAGHPEVLRTSEAPQGSDKV